MTPTEVFKLGFNRGYVIASDTEIRDVGDSYETSVGSEITIENEDEIEEAFMAEAFDAEANDRSFSPFEFTAFELNELEAKIDLALERNKKGVSAWFSKKYEHDSPWDVFEEGIEAGIEKNFEERK